MNRRAALQSLAALFAVGVVQPSSATADSSRPKQGHIRNGWHVYWRDWVAAPNQLVSIGVWQAWRHQSGAAVSTTRLTSEGWEPRGWAMPTTGVLQRVHALNVLDTSIVNGWTDGNNLTPEDRDAFKARAFNNLIEALE